MSREKLDCDIVSDLLPLYHDGVVKKTTAEAIKEHLESCDACRQEYEALFSDLDLEVGEVHTKKRFSDMMKSFKRKRLIVSAVAVVLICALILGGYNFATQACIVNLPGDEITVHYAYRYKTDEGYKMFVIYSHAYNGSSFGDISVKETENERILQMNIKRPLLYKMPKGVNVGDREDIWDYEFGYESGDNGSREYVDFDKVEFAGKVIWTKEENADDEIPEYVYEHDKFSDDVENNIRSCSMNLDEGTISIGYGDGKYIKWKLDGTLIYDGYQDKE